MTSDVFGAWLERSGYRVAAHGDGRWYEIAPRVWQAFPYHLVQSLADADLDAVLRKPFGVALRYVAPLHAPEGQISYQVVKPAGPWQLAALPKKARHDVARGLETFEIREIDPRELADRGWALRRETLARQGRERAETEADFRRICLAAAGLRGFEAWATFRNGVMSASLLASRVGDCCAILYQQSRTEDLSAFSNNALAFTYSREAGTRDGVRVIFYGLHSLDAPASVDRFKLRMGFELRPVRQRVVLHPRLHPVAGLAHTLARAAQVVSPSLGSLSKAEGLLRFHRNGRLPLAMQTWPDLIADRREAILADVERHER